MTPPAPRSARSGGGLSSPRLQAALEDAARDGRRLQVAACRDGKVLVDAASGPDAENLVFPIFSVGKGIVALAVHLQALRGRLELDAPVAEYWPEYARHGKQSITVRHVLSHRAGVPQVPPELTPERLGDRVWLTDWLADVTPLFAPGCGNAYLPLTFGWILAEVVRRTDERGRRLDAFVRDELCEPLGAEGFWFGIPPEIEARVPPLSYPEPPPPPPPDAPVLLANPAAVALGPAVFNRSDVHRTMLPAVGAIADARSLARLFSVYAGRGLVDGRRWVSDGSISDCLTPRPGFDAVDMTYGRRLPVGQGGLWIEAPGVVPTHQAGVLAHPGAGGSVAWAELDSGLSAAICHDQMFTSAAEHPNHPFSAIADAVRELAGVGGRPVADRPRGNDDAVA